ncbi:SDR family oxidoreductase [Paenibacillus alkalitolerans]|uniref:SDR family oxidoreductase n=1 Tax=Paenibacillus alkalitolerans TaxID=2799335 RepID=UPI0018F3D3D6|nr:SDR family oxidoreductase [Paenibacillus alkalitolerans]
MKKITVTALSLIGVFVSIMAVMKSIELFNVKFDGSGIGVYFLIFEVNDRVLNEAVIYYAWSFLVFVCLRSDAIPETWPEPADDVRTYMENGTALGRLPTLNEVANAAVFAASDRASTMTGTIVNLTCGSIMD